MDRLLFGDNQFFGVNHMSEEKARSQSMRFRDTQSIVSVLDAAYDEGVHTFMCTTHDRIAEVISHYRDEPSIRQGRTYFPCMPYAHKYANAMTEAGVFGAVRRFLPERGLIDTALRGGLSVARRDIEGIVTLLLDAEMTMFRAVETPVVFLQNVTVDMVLGLGMFDLLRVFADHVRSEYGAEPGFITMNLVRLLDGLDSVGVVNPIVCANMNKIGFRMSGGIPAYEDALRNRKFRAIAMSVFASGAIPPREALEWVAGLPNIESVVFGASNRAHIAESVELARGFWPDV